jgi:threonylcarbamoyladenosine tRNA methylthiotransferase MtaB
MPKVALGFTGCKVNNYEVQALSQALEDAGMEIVPFSRKADCYVINTCTVTSRADVSSRNLVRRARRISPEARIVVTGCYAQLKRQELAEIGVDLLVPNQDKERIPQKVLRLFSDDESGTDVEEPPEFGALIISKTRGLTRGFVKIQEGCDRKCTYCTIWISRGPVRSRNPRYVIDEIKKLHSNGYLEIVLTGVHIGLYQYDDLDLSSLIEKILAETDVPRIRLSSMYPAEIDDRFMRLFANRRICPHVHLSIQSGDDEILREMGRDYSGSDVLRIVNRLNDSVTDITVGADFITGFPGETDAQFRNSADLIERSGIHHLHVFPFSARPGTRAAEMVNPVPADMIKRRTDHLRVLGGKKKESHLAKFINRELRVLIENRTADNMDLLTGLSENYLRVRLAAKADYRGRIIAVRPHYVANGELIADVRQS